MKYRRSEKKSKRSVKRKKSYSNRDIAIGSVLGLGALGLGYKYYTGPKPESKKNGLAQKSSTSDERDNMPPPPPLPPSNERKLPQTHAQIQEILKIIDERLSILMKSRKETDVYDDKYIPISQSILSLRTERDNLINNQFGSRSKSRKLNKRRRSRK